MSKPIWAEIGSVPCATWMCPAYCLRSERGWRLALWWAIGGSAKLLASPCEVRGMAPDTILENLFDLESGICVALFFKDVLSEMQTFGILGCILREAK